jgi:hypothetical protein
LSQCDPSARAFLGPLTPLSDDDLRRALLLVREVVYSLRFTTVDAGLDGSRFHFQIWNVDVVFTLLTPGPGVYAYISTAVTPGDPGDVNSSSFWQSLRPFSFAEAFINFFLLLICPVSIWLNLKAVVQSAIFVARNIRRTRAFEVQAVRPAAPPRREETERRESAISKLGALLRRRSNSANKDVELLTPAQASDAKRLLAPPPRAATFSYGGWGRNERNLCYRPLRIAFYFIYLLCSALFVPTYPRFDYEHILYFGLCF